MQISRRTFVSLLLARLVQKSSLSAEVLEIFEDGNGSLVVLVHHADPATRGAFAEWLQSHPRSSVYVRTRTGEEAAGKMFRVRMCFGRGLILLEKPLQVRERDVLTIGG